MIDIRYAQIRECDVSNGEGIGVALFVQGCRFRCPNCFNPETWDFNGGKEWITETKDKFIELASRPYIKRISILGGEPLADENLDDVLDLVNEFRLSFPQKSIWLYSGYRWEDIFEGILCQGFQKYEKLNQLRLKRKDIISQCTVMIDGQYIDSQRNLSLPWHGSENQRVIDIQKTLQLHSLKGEIVLWQT